MVKIFAVNACIQNGSLLAKKKKGGGELIFKVSEVKFHDGPFIWTPVYLQENFHAFVILSTVKTCLPLTGFFNKALWVSRVCSTWVL